MFKKIGSLLVTLLGLALLVYSASRSLHFIEATLPADRAILAYFGLAALDGGLLAWLLAYQHGSHGGWQRGIALLMVVVDLLGCVLMFTLDSLLETGEAGLTVAFTPEQMTSAILMLSLIIALNIAATVAHHLTDPASLRDQADEEAAGKIEDKARDQVSKSADQLAAELAPILADNWVQSTRARYLNLLDQRQPPALTAGTIDAQARDVQPTARETAPARAERRAKQRARRIAFWPRWDNQQYQVNTPAEVDPANFTPPANGRQQE